MADQEVIPPYDPLTKEGRTPHQRLRTTGQIKSELGKIYRRVNANKLDQETARTLSGILRIMLAATEQEHAHQLAAEDDEADTPSLTGVKIFGPGYERLPAPSTRKKEKAK